MTFADFLYGAPFLTRGRVYNLLIHLLLGACQRCQCRIQVPQYSRPYLTLLFETGFPFVTSYDSQCSFEVPSLSSVKAHREETNLPRTKFLRYRGDTSYPSNDCSFIPAFRRNTTQYCCTARTLRC
jgi:hypothetical protein